MYNCLKVKIGDIMSKHLKNLDESALWKLYKEKNSDEEIARVQWIKKVYTTAITYLKRVCSTFPNYTLHDETHVLNVLHAIEGILGNEINKLSVGEIELLILSAALHDIGMVYDEADMETAFNDERKCKRFLQENEPELIGVPYTEWPENTKQWYLRTLHPFRLPEILNNDEWKNIFSERPHEVIPMQNIIAVCQSHGERISTIKNNNLLKYLSAKKTEPLFCTMLLRLADLLDFDDTRAPKILFKYATVNKDSIKEWKKHTASMGFIYPPVPSNDKLIFSAECEEPAIEYSIRNFLDWIDDEFVNCNELKNYCKKEWQRQFQFPHSVSRDNITSIGYVSDKLMLTIDQTQMLKLLTGENIYKNNDVFVRELLQNAIDAILLRSKMDKNFKIEEARIDLWEWSDNDGNIWFRIDDQGTGMTIGMLKNYFLKVGNSYYTSKELKRDLSHYANKNNFSGISRFGIGFLSCFLCGVEAEISTLYFDDSKSKAEYDSSVCDRNGYGLRMNITGLYGYYTLKSQANSHAINTLLPAPDFIDSSKCPKLEYNGYRSKAGTSIVIKLDSKKIEINSLKTSAEKYLCGTRMPVYYNGERIAFTYSEIMDRVNEFKREMIFELSDDEKKEFDEKFPISKGKYPKVVIKVIPLNIGKNSVLSNFSGILFDYHIVFDNPPQWRFYDQTYSINANIIAQNESTKYFIIFSNNIIYEDKFYRADFIDFDDLSKEYGYKNVDILKHALENFTTCPTSGEKIGNAWLPFAEKEDISEIWRIYIDEKQNVGMEINLNNKINPKLMELLNINIGESNYVALFYQGVLVDNFYRYSSEYRKNDIIWFLENELQPNVDIGRNGIISLPLEAIMAICVNMHNFDDDFFYTDHFKMLESVKKNTLPKWRCIRYIDIGRHILKTQKKLILYMQEFLENKIEFDGLFNINIEFNSFSINKTYNNIYLKIIYRFILAYFQDIYDMRIYYEEGQKIAFNKKKNSKDDTFDEFPPMMFCKAGSNISRRYLCCSDSTSVLSH